MEYTYNLLEAHLHHNEIIFTMVCVGIMALLTLFRLFAFFSVISSKPVPLLNKWRLIKKALSVLTVLFLIGSQIGIGVMQSKNSGDTRDGLPEGLPYVAMGQFFPVEQANVLNQNARTNYGKTDEVVPENYAVYLNFNNLAIESRCVKILDNTILSDYYRYEKDKWAGSEMDKIQSGLNEAQKALLNAEDGFIRNDTYANIVEVVFLKDSRVIQVELRGINADLDTMLTEIGISYR